MNFEAWLEIVIQPADMFAVMKCAIIMEQTENHTHPASLYDDKVDNRDIELLSTFCLDALSYCVISGKTFSQNG